MNPATLEPIPGEDEWGFDATGGRSSRRPLRGLDGILYAESAVRVREISDGTSNTILVGEALPTATDSTEAEKKTDTRKDHWAIGGDDADGSNDGSEHCGSTALPMNTEHELAFGSAHIGGTNAVFVDNSVRFIHQEIDRTVWSRLGSRADGYPIDASQLK